MYVVICCMYLYRWVSMRSVAKSISHLVRVPFLLPSTICIYI